jgi:starch-binding outer membrane protein, SusD/RagB family
MKKALLLTALLIFGVVYSCRETELDQFNPNQLTPDSYFKNGTEVLSGVNSVYALLQGNGLVGREWFFLNHLRGDDFASGGGQLETPRNQILNGVHDPANYVLNEVWNAAYRGIHRCNSVIQAASKITDANDALAKRAVGEARFLRGFLYGELALFWGGVPLYDQVASKPGDAKARATEADVIAFALNDLNAAETALPASYTGADVGRATKGAAQMTKARLQMLKGDYAAAKTELQKIVSNTQYKLVNDYVDNFREENEWNTESIFELGFSAVGDINWAGDGNDPAWGNQERMVRTQEYSVTGWRNLIPSQTLIDEFEHTSKGDAKIDPRRGFSFWVIGDKFNNGKTDLTDGLVQGNTSTFDGKTTKVSWAKYSAHYKMDPGGYNNLGINYRIMRLSEALLSLAECEIELGNNAEAIRLMNLVRARPSVAMPPYPTTRFPCSNKAQTFEALVHEKRVELNGEEVRNRDLLRWRRQGKLTPAITPKFLYSFETRHLLLPIPQAEVDNNAAIEQKDQNPGY